MTDLLKTITSIPWFAWVLFGYVIYRGVTALQTQIVSIQKICIIPVIFFGMGLSGLVKQNPSPDLVALWIGLISIAAYVIWYRMRPLKVVCDRQKKLIQIPGGWTTLILLLSIFTSKFTFGFLSATHPELKELMFFNLINLSISGIVCGISFGRVVALLLKFYKSPHVDLKFSE